MPWKKSFSEEDAIHDAMMLFWEKGYDSTSIADLLTGLNINRGSLYNAFGGKRNLFIKALTKYDKEIRHTSLAKLEALDDPVKAIETLFDNAVSEAVADKQKKGCFLVNTASEISAHDQDVVEITRQGMHDFVAFFRRCIEVGQARGEILANLEPQATARKLLALTSAIRLLGRGIFEESDLQIIADEAKRTIRDS